MFPRLERVRILIRRIYLVGSAKVLTVWLVLGSSLWTLSISSHATLGNEAKGPKARDSKGLGCIFGSDVPVGYNVYEKANRVGAQQSTVKDHAPTPKRADLVQMSPHLPPKTGMTRILLSVSALGQRIWSQALSVYPYASGLE